MKTNWQTKKLGEVCDILDNKRKPITKRNRTNGEYPYYGATGILDYVGDYIFDEKLVLIGEDGAKWESGEHTAFIADGKYWVNNHAHVIRPHRNIILDNWIVFYFYLTNLTKHTTGLTVPKLNQANLRNIKIPLPSLPEQRRIVKILDEVFADVAKAKENAEKNLQNVKELFESYLQNAFANPGKDWEEKSLGEVLQKTETINPLNNPNKEFIYIDVSSVNNKNLSIENTSLIKGKTAPSRARKLVRTDDVIFATVRPTLKRIAIIPKKFNEQVCSTGYFVLRAKANFVNKLLFYIIQTKSFNEKIEKLQKGASYPAVTDSDVKNQIISFPKSLSEQKSIVAKLDALSAETKKLEAIYKQKLADLEELKKSVLKSAFAGKF